MTVTLGTLNRMDRAAFVQMLGAVFEHSPWIAEAAWEKRPFIEVDALHRAMVDAVMSAGYGRQLALLKAHPELGASEVADGFFAKRASGSRSR